MPGPSLDNPFRKPPRSKKEAEEISELLLGKKGKGEKVLEEAPIVELSEEEQAIAEKAEVSPWTREQMEEWAKKFNLDDDWIDKNLEQNDDGTWTAKKLDLEFLESPEDFPKGIIKVKNSLYLTSLTSAEDLILPKSIGGFLYLASLTSTEHLILPDGFTGAVFLTELPDSEKEELRKKYPNAKIY